MSGRRRYPLMLPDLGLGDVTITAGMWLVEPGSPVTAGDRVLEICGGSVTVDLPSPATGILAEVLVAEDDVLVAGQTLAVIETDAKSAE